MGGPSPSYIVGPRWTMLLLLVICLCPVTTGGLRNNSNEGILQNGTYIDRDLTPRVQNINSTVTPIDSTTQGYVDSDTDRVTTAGYNVTLCEAGFGYPEQCPQPGDPITHTKCCRYYQTPKCCEPRARKVCAVKDKGLFVITAWDIDPELEYDAIFCPQPDQSDEYVSCGYTRGDMTCYNRQMSLVLVWVTSIVIFVLFPIAFCVFTIHSIRAEQREERQMLADGLFVRREVEIEERMVKKKAEKAAAAKAAEKVAEKEKKEREKRIREMAMANGRKKSSANIEVNGRKESSEVIEANRRRKSSENIEVTSIEANIEVT